MANVVHGNQYNRWPVNTFEWVEISLYTGKPVTRAGEELRFSIDFPHGLPKILLLRSFPTSNNPACDVFLKGNGNTYDEIENKAFFIESISDDSIFFSAHLSSSTGYYMTIY